jgi:hypothetical protein
MHRLLEKIADHPVLGGLVLLVVIEIVTLIGRFGLGMRAADHRDELVRLTLGLRVHHGYPGLLLVAVWLVARLLHARGHWPGVVGAVGIGLLGSDAVHHIILKLVTGSADFP